MAKTTKLTISLANELVEMADKIAFEEKVSRSHVISRCLSESYQKRKDALLREGYLAMASEHKKTTEASLEVQSEILQEWK
jgi:metal-responsive CopG/Arc/MetJ family transcriptional regulator